MRDFSQAWKSCSDALHVAANEPWAWDAPSWLGCGSIDVASGGSCGRGEGSGDLIAAAAS